MILHDADNIIRLDLPASLQYLHLAGSVIRALLENPEAVDETIAYNSELAVYEICTNIVEHAYEGGGHASPQRIELVCYLRNQPRALVVAIRDTGRALKRPLQEPVMPEPGQSRGYGLFLVYQLMDEVHYHSDADGNHWQLTKHLNEQQGNSRLHRLTGL